MKLNLDFELTKHEILQAIKDGVAESIRDFYSSDEKDREAFLTRIEEGARKGFGIDFLVNYVEEAIERHESRMHDNSPVEETY